MSSFLLLIESLVPIKKPPLPIPKRSSDAVSRAPAEEPIILLSTGLPNTGAAKDPSRKEGARRAPHSGQITSMRANDIDPALKEDPLTREGPGLIKGKQTSTSEPCS